nr:hypothetical protein HK105_000310 [Polyrhizophydium stewartii]
MNARPTDSSRWSQPVVGKSAASLLNKPLFESKHARPIRRDVEASVELPDTGVDSGADADAESETQGPADDASDAWSDELEPRFAKYYRFETDELEDILRGGGVSGSATAGGANGGTSTSSSSGSSSRARTKASGIYCTLTPACSAASPFFSVAEYEEHYQMSHVNKCIECRRILPTARLLHLHLLEVHDKYFSILARRQHSYECFVDLCPHLSQTPKDRNRHLIQHHRFPKGFDFEIVLGAFLESDQPRPPRPPRCRPTTASAASEVQGAAARATGPHADPRTGRHRSGSSRRRRGAAGGEDMDLVQTPPTEEPSTTDDAAVVADSASIDSLTASMSKLMIPRSVAFGRRRAGRVESLAAVRKAHQSQAPAPQQPAPQQPAPQQARRPPPSGEGEPQPRPARQQRGGAGGSSVMDLGE